MGPTWVLSAPSGPHVGPMNLAIRVYTIAKTLCAKIVMQFLVSVLASYVTGIHCYPITTLSRFCIFICVWKYLYPPISAIIYIRLSFIDISNETISSSNKFQTWQWNITDTETESEYAHFHSYISNIGDDFKRINIKSGCSRDKS